MARMKLVLGALLLLCVHSSWRVSSGTLLVTQSPDVSFQEGETGNITCCLKRTAERFRITWMKNQTLIKNQTFINQSTGSQNEQKNNCAFLTIETANKNDSGRYICKVHVEIPTLINGEGNGTTITVTARENPANSTAGGNPSAPRQPVLQFVLKCLLLFTVISAFSCIHYLVRKPQKTFTGSAAAENNDISLQSREEGQGEEEEEEREIDTAAISPEESENYAAHLPGVLEDNAFNSNDWIYSAEL